MGLNIANLTTGADIDGNSTAATASVTPGANKLILLTVTHRTNITTDPNEPTVTGNGLTWVKVNTLLWDTTSSTRKRTTVFRAMGASPSTGAISIDFGGQNQTDVVWVVDEVSGMDTSGTNGSGAIVQSVTNKDESVSASTLTVTLAAFSSASNGTYGVFAADNNRTSMTVGSGFTQGGFQNSGNGVNSIETGTEWRSDNDTTVDVTWSTNLMMGGIAIELKSATIFNDLFTRATDVALQTHTPTPTGTSWTKLWASSVNSELQVDSTSDYVYEPDTINEGSIYTADATYPSANYTVEASLSLDVGTFPVYLLARIADQENMYALRMVLGTNACQLYKKVAGTWTALGTIFSSGMTAGVAATVKLEVNDTTIKAYVNDVQKDSVTDSALSATGKAGLAGGGGAELVNNTDDLQSTQTIDNFLVTDLGTSGTTTTTSTSTTTTSTSTSTSTSSSTSSSTTTTSTSSSTSSSSSSSTTTSTSSSTSTTTTSTSSSTSSSSSTSTTRTTTSTSTSTSTSTTTTSTSSSTSTSTTTTSTSTSSSTTTTSTSTSSTTSTSTSSSTSTSTTTTSTSTTTTSTSTTTTYPYSFSVDYATE